MPAVDALLRLLVQNGGDELRIEVGRPPVLLRAGTALKLYLPTVTEPMADQLLLGLRGEERRRRVSEEGTVRFAHEPEGLERFAAAVWGDGARSAWFGRGAAMERGPSPSTAEAQPPPNPREERQAQRRQPVDEPPDELPPPSVHHATPSTQDVDALIARAIALGASDLHLAEGQPPMARVDGRLRALTPDPCGAAAILHLPPDVLALRDGRRLRMTHFRTDHGPAVAIRLPARALPALHELGHPLPLDALAELDHGLVLLGGPTGSGKTTTLASLVVHRLQQRGGVVVTIEDPIEHRYDAPPGSLVHQRQIGRHVPDAATGLRDALRQDPDVLVIGELRDPEAIQLALTAAETGQLVLATLHCRSAASAIERILDAVPAARQGQVRGQLALALRAVVVHRLLPRLGGGRVLASEILRNTGPVSALLRDGRTGQLATALQTGAAEGMMPLERHLSDLVARGAISRADALQAANDPAALAGYGA